MRIALVVIAALIAVVLIAVAVGSFLPQGHVARGSILLRQTPESVWAVITDFPNQTSWRKDLKAAELVEDAPAGALWRETTDDALLLRTTEATAPTRLVRTIADTTLPFGGRWIYDLQPEGPGTRVTVTEEGEVYNPIFRLMSRFFDARATLRTYLTALGARFGETLTLDP